jgi:hypothetical protein
MRTTPLIVLVMLLLQTPRVFSETGKECLVAVERASKSQTEQLMNRYYTGQIGGLEFEDKRYEILSHFAVEREVCEQKILAVVPQESYDLPATKANRNPNGNPNGNLSRAPASLGIELGGDDENSDGSGDDSIDEFDAHQ